VGSTPTPGIADVQGFQAGRHPPASRPARGDTTCPCPKCANGPRCFGAGPDGTVKASSRRTSSPSTQRRSWPNRWVKTRSSTSSYRRAVGNVSRRWLRKPLQVQNGYTPAQEHPTSHTNPQRPGCGNPAPHAGLRLSRPFSSGRPFGLGILCPQGRAGSTPTPGMRGSRACAARGRRLWRAAGRSPAGGDRGGGPASRRRGRIRAGSAGRSRCRPGPAGAPVCRRPGRHRERRGRRQDPARAVPRHLRRGAHGPEGPDCERPRPALDRVRAGLPLERSLRRVLHGSAGRREDRGATGAGRSRRRPLGPDIAPGAQADRAPLRRRARLRAGRPAVRVDRR
jgi:hypothetical protein